MNHIRVGFKRSLYRRKIYGLCSSKSSWISHLHWMQKETNKQTKEPLTRNLLLDKPFPILSFLLV